MTTTHLHDPDLDLAIKEETGNIVDRRRGDRGSIGGSRCRQNRRVRHCDDRVGMSGDVVEECGWRMRWALIGIMNVKWVVESREGLECIGLYSAMAHYLGTTSAIKTRQTNTDSNTCLRCKTGGAVLRCYS